MPNIQIRHERLTSSLTLSATRRRFVIEDSAKQTSEYEGLYWIFIVQRKWKFFKQKDAFCSHKTYDEVRAFVNSLREQFPSAIFRIGITRGAIVYLID